MLQCLTVRLIHCSKLQKLCNVLVRTLITEYRIRIQEDKEHVSQYTYLHSNVDSYLLTGVDNTSLSKPREWTLVVLMNIIRLFKCLYNGLNRTYAPISIHIVNLKSVNTPSYSIHIFYTRGKTQLENSEPTLNASKLNMSCEHFKHWIYLACIEFPVNITPIKTHADTWSRVNILIELLSAIQCEVMLANTKMLTNNK